jgi:uncharacterized protein with ParB-like and HNH nuclease domain
MQSPSKLSISDLFQQREQYLIPLFQRGYVWTLTDQIQPLWEDIMDRVDALKEFRENAQKVNPEKLKQLRKHFLGAIITGSPVSADGQVPTREVIDGQQRTTTFQILLLALRDVLKPIGDEALDHDVRDLTYNVGNYKTKSDRLKVWPTNSGRDTMLTLNEVGSFADVCKQFSVKKNGEKIERPLMVQAYLFFFAMISCLLRTIRYDSPVSATDRDDEKTVAQTVIRSIGKDNLVLIPFLDRSVNTEPARLLVDALRDCFQIIRIQLDAEDDPQIIFETLNARGTPLQPSDLIRNFLFLRASRKGEDVDALYERYWREFDEKLELGAGAKGAKFWKKEERQGRLKNSRLDLLLYHYIGLRKREVIKVSHVFEEFREWWGETRVTDKELEKLMRLARHFEIFIHPEQQSRFGQFCRRMKLLDTATLTPLVFYLLEHHEPDSADFIQAITDLESYVVRRFVCGLTTQGYNRIFLTKLLAEMGEEKKSDADTLRKGLLSLSGTSQKWPEDAEFRDSWIQRQLYKGGSTRKVSAILEGLELGLGQYRKEFKFEFDTLSVEHVLPQKWRPEDYPLSADTAEAREKRARLLHSIGNMTLVTPNFNSALSNERFEIKHPAIVAEKHIEAKCVLPVFFG